MITQVRTARPEIMLNGQDYYSSLAPYFLNLSYTDNCDGKKADDLQLQLADRDRKFINEWMPDKGVFMDVAIICERWFAPNAASLKLDCGRFWIDSVDFELPQHTVSVKAQSIPTDVRIKGGEETRGWENNSLQDIGGQIAGENDMLLDWQANYNPRYKRVEQVEESGLAFLKKRASDAKLAIKVCRNKVIVFDEEDYEKQAPSFTLVYGNVAASGGTAYRMTGGHFSRKATDTKKSVAVKHINPETGRLVDEKATTDDEDVSEIDDNLIDDPDFEPDEGGNGSLLITPRSSGLINWDANNPSENAGKGAGGTAKGQRRAKAALRESNKDKETASVELAIGNPLIAAGQTFILQGVGQFDGKWFIESATHKLAPMYETSLSIRRCLEGY
jgi:phage protein D